LTRDESIQYACSGWLMLFLIKWYGKELGMVPPLLIIFNLGKIDRYKNASCQIN
jgi:hypothetical protein